MSQFSGNHVEKLKLLNLEIHNWTFQAFLENLKEGVVVTPNVDHYIKLQKDEDFYNCYVKSEHIVCDSRIIQLLSKVVHGKNAIKEQIAGSDLFPAFCEHHKNNTDNMRVFLLGGTEESVVIAQNKINDKAENEVVIEGYSPPFGFESDEAENQKIINMINDSGATVLAVGVGAPKQEKWIYANKDNLPNIKIFFAIGATIDFQAGAVKRAPRWMVNAGLEWLYRMMQEPNRMIKRYLVDDLPFFWLVLKQKFGIYKNPWEKG